MAVLSDIVVMVFVLLEVLVWLYLIFIGLGIIDE